MRRDLPIERAASGSFFAPNSNTKTAARMSRCHGLNSPIRMILPRGCPSVRREPPQIRAPRRSSARSRHFFHLGHRLVDPLPRGSDLTAELAHLPPEPQGQQAKDSDADHADGDVQESPPHGGSGYACSEPTAQRWAPAVARAASM